MASDKKESSSATVPSRQAQHEALAKAAGAQQALFSSLKNGVSMHKMSQSVSFAQLRSIMSAASGNEQRTFVGTVDGSIVVSVNFNYEPQRLLRHRPSANARELNEESRASSSGSRPKVSRPPTR